MRNETMQGGFAGIVDEGMSTAQWDSLPVAIRVAQRLADIIILLGQIRDELHTEEGSALLWMEESVDRAFSDTDGLMRKLAV
jgi:hypothetical protein